MSSHLLSLSLANKLPSLPPTRSLSLSTLSLSSSLSTMATTSLQSLHHPSLPHHHHHPHSFSSSLSLLRPISASNSLTAATTAPTFDALAGHLAASDFRRADEETRRLLIDLAGEPAQKRGYVFFSEVSFISAPDLLALDRLWRHHSAGKFGYSTQRRLWDKSRRDFTTFFIRIGWMKKLDTPDVDQYNYRAFPDEFVWSLADAPEGHLPLTNALRGTQLMASILTHPAFDDGAGEVKGLEEEIGVERVKPSFIEGSRSLKADYSF